MRTKTLKVSDGNKLKIHDFPNFHRSGSIIGMKKLYYGEDALLVRCGSYIFNVTSEPRIYNLAY
jgi:hypothetical protein